MRRLRDIPLVLGILLFIVPSATAVEVLTNDAIITMVKAGLGDELIISKIKISQGQFALSTDDVLQLKKVGVSEAVIKAMIEASAPPAFARPKTAEVTAQETQDAIALYRQGKNAEAAAAFDKLIAERPDDDDLKIWKALALLEQARAMKDANRSGYKPLVVSAYSILQPLGRRIPKNPDWNFAMAKAFWLNDRPHWAKTAAGKALEFRTNFAEPQLLLGDLAYDSEVESLSRSAGSPQRDTALLWPGTAARKEYEKALAMREMTAAQQAEALYKLGKVSADLEKKPGVACEFWERAVAADPDSRYARMAQEKLTTVPAK